MSAMTWLDDQIIDRIYQPIVNASQLDQEQACRYCLIGTIVFNAYSMYLQVSYYHNWVDLVTRIIGVTFICIIYWQPRPTGDRFNFFRHSPLFLLIRYFVIISLLMTIYKIISIRPEVLYLNDTLGSLVYVSFWYFLACSKPPPKQHKVFGEALAG